MIETKQRQNRGRRRAFSGDIVTVDLNLEPDNGYVPDPLFDTVGSITFVLGWGNYLPGLHSLVAGMSKDDEIRATPIDAGWGERRSDLVVSLPRSKVKALKDIDSLQEGAAVVLTGGLEVQIVEITPDTITVDANPPLAGAGFLCDMTLLNIESLPLKKMVYHEDKIESSRFEVATFALSCFWGAELAFMREPGVAGTRAGFTQGIKPFPTYEEVCSGVTQHREAVMVIYDPQVVSYSQLMDLAFKRLAVTSNKFKSIFGDETTDQYRHGFYYHNPEQRRLAEERLQDGNRFDVELRPATKFYDAEDYHQQYLLKGGQSARKGARETIRCFG